MHNFAANQATLPKSILDDIAKEANNINISDYIFNCDHRTPRIDRIFLENKELLRLILKIPNNYEILFMANGASLQYSSIAMNLNKKNHANYFISGFWSEQAANEAKKFTNVTLSRSWNAFIDPETHTDYTHYVSNETFTGIRAFPAKGIGNLVADMTSSIMTEEIDWSSHKLIYSSCQKNLGISGMSIVIFDPSILNKNSSKIPLLLDYDKQLQADSRLNTVPVFNMYILNKMLKWLQEKNIYLLAKIRNEIACNIYNMIDNSSIAYNNIEKNIRSNINICFDFRDNTILNKFINECKSIGIININGFKDIGGIRISLYNSCIENKIGINCLINILKKYLL